jgi:signal transduction histidine kinase
MVRAILQSLHARMLALSIGATLVALVLAGWAITTVLERFVIGGLDQRLDAEVTLLASTVDANGQIDRTRLHQQLGAMEGKPGWRWQIDAPGSKLGSEDFPHLDAGPPLLPPPSLSGTEGLPFDHDDQLRPLEGASEEGFPVHARTMTLETRGGPVTLTALAPRSVVRRPIMGALAPLMAALAALAALLGGATLIQLRLGLRPIRRLREQVAAIRAGARESVDEDQATELKPLAVELNALSRENKAALAAARQSAANLAHALKTPVAALALELRDEPGRAAQLARIDATIRHHLARARADAADRRATTRLAPAIEDLVTAVRRLHSDRPLTIEADIPSDLAIAVDHQDLDELVGNLLDNAARFAASRVFVVARALDSDARRVVVEIGDDGPGIPAAERSQVTKPGVRLDERGDGHGFGLTIVTDLIALYGGTVRLEDRQGGGLAVCLTLPAAQSTSSAQDAVR